MNRAKGILKVLLMCAIFMLVGVIFCKDSVFADEYGYVDIDASTPPPSSGDTTGGTCSESDMRWAPWCSGASWVYYKAMNKAPQGSVLFGTEATELQNNSSKQVYVPSECQGTDEYGNNIGGFWHYGMNGQGIMFTGWYNSVYYTNKVRFQRSLYNLDLYNIGGAGQWGHWGTVGYNIYSWWTEKPLVNISHDILDSNGYTIYTAQKSAMGTTGGEVAKNFYDACWKDSRISDEDKPSICGTDKENASIPTGTYLFCYWDGMSSNFYGKSGASAGGSTEETNIVSMGSMASAGDVTVDIKVNEEATLNFYHKVYSDNSDSQINWKVNRNAGPQSFLDNGSGYEVISGRPSGSTTSGTVTFGNNKESGKYIPNSGSTVLSDGGIKIKFTAKGVYTFCETLVLNKEGENNNYTSKACVTVNVDGGGSSGGDLSDVCEKFKPSSFNDGYSSVVSKIKNERFGGWEDLIYAKPTDRIQWLNCYYPGAQLNYDATITISHGPPSGSSCPTNNKSFSSAYSFTNQYEVKTDSPFGMNNNSWSKNESYISDTFKPFSLKLGATDAYKKEAQNNYIVERDKVGNTYTDTIKISAGVPIYTKVWEDKHEWKYTVPKTCWDSYPVSVPDGNGGTTIDWVPYSYDCSYEETASHPVYEYEYSASTLLNEPSDNAVVKIPYNFDNKTNFSMVPKSSENVVYAGETVDVSGTTVTVGTRQNGVVEANYATNVDGAQVKLIAYVADENRSGTDPAASSFDCGSVNPVQSSLCGEAKYSSGTLKVDNPDKGQVFNDTTKILGETFDGSYNVFDARAGDWFCMSLGVYPAKSGTDDEDGDKNLSASGNDKWYVYTPTCYQIAKKPSFQIWGGGLYSAGEISTFVSEKNNIYGIGSVGMKTFGSWVEQNATAKGTITNFASGAALGKNKTQGDKVGYGLSSSLSEFCKYMVPLTFANYLSNSTNPCSNGSVGQSDINPITSNVKALVDYWGSVTENSSCSNVGGISGKMAASGNAEKDICISDVNGDVTIGASGVGWSQTRIVKANNVTIDGYIEYQNDGFDRLSEIPKVIIYAKNDIKISCDVKRVDAILIAEKTIYSCNEYSGSGTVSGTDEDTIRSKQLVVNGAMIANRLELGRTYGNTMGTESNDPQPNLANPKIGSETPAEIINYDVSILLWGESMAGAEESDTLTVTYQHELAPRY